MLLASSLIAAAFSFFIAFLALKNNIKNHTRLFFSLFCITIGLWTIANYFSLQDFSKEAILFWMRFVMALAVMQSISFFMFVHTFPRRKLFLKKKKIIIYFCVGLLAIVVCFSPLLFKDVNIQDGQRSPVVQPGMLLFLIVAVGSIILGFTILIKRYRKDTGEIKRQYKYILIGTALMFAFIIVFNLLFAGLLHNSSFVDYSPFFLLPFILLISYAIFRHSMLNIRLVLLRTVTYSIVVLLIATTVVSLMLILPQVLAIDTTARAVIAVLVSIFIVLILDPLKKVVANATDQLFFKAKIDYQKLVAELSDIINREIDLDILLYTLSHKLETRIKVKNVSVYLAGTAGGAFYKRQGMVTSEGRKKGIGDLNQNEFENTLTNRIAHNSSLLRYLRNKKQVVLLESLERKIEDIQGEEERKDLEKSKVALDKLDAAVIAPILVGNNLNAVMVLGPKLSGDPIGSEDLNLLQLIGPQLASALEKSRLYEEAKQFTERLKKEVAVATEDLRDTNLQLQESNRELGEANKHLQQLDQAKSEFVSIASHQLRTPMTGIMGYLSMVLQGDFGKVPLDQKKVLSNLLEESQRMIRLINLFLNVTKIESSKMELNLVPLQISETIEKVRNMVQKAAVDKKIKLVFKKPSQPLPKIMADSDKLGDIILNLVDNAIKYTDKGSVIITAEHEDKNIHIAVKDTGRGIAKDEAKKLFTKFVRGYGIAQINPDGSGLGLYVAKRLTEAHKGKIWVESGGKGKGSTFHITIPIAKSGRM